jgi:hypothetical protein
MQVRQSDITDFQREGFADCCNALVGKSEMETAIQRSLELFGNGLFIVEPNEMFVTHMTCLEMTLIESYERGLSPQVYQLYEGIIQPLLNQHGLVDRKQILTEYHRQYGRFLADEKLRREVLPALEASGLITQSPDPGDRRRMLVCGSTTDPPPISPPETMGGTSEGVRTLPSEGDTSSAQRNRVTAADQRELIA